MAKETIGTISTNFPENTREYLLKNNELKQKRAELEEKIQEEAGNILKLTLGEKRKQKIMEESKRKLEKMFDVDYKELIELVAELKDNHYANVAIAKGKMEELKDFNPEINETEFMKLLWLDIEDRKEREDTEDTEETKNVEKTWPLTIEELKNINFDDLWDFQNWIFAFNDWIEKEEDGKTYIKIWGRKFYEKPENWLGYTIYNGSVYIGEYEKYKREWKGTKTWTDGSTYKWAWKNNKREWEGTYTNISWVKFYGIWEKHKLVKIRNQRLDPAESLFYLDMIANPNYGKIVE